MTRVLVVSSLRLPIPSSGFVRRMRSHVQQTIACLTVLRQLRSIRRSLPTSVFQTLVVTLVLSKLNYGNATLVGLPVNLLSRLLSVLNAAAQSIAGLHRSAHITDTLVN